MTTPAGRALVAPTTSNPGDTAFIGNVNTRYAFEDHVHGREAGGGGGGITQSYVGYNTVGASWENIGGDRCIVSKITLASAGTIISVEAYLRQSGPNAAPVWGVVYTDNSGTPDKVIMVSSSGAVNASTGFYLNNSGTNPGPGRWMSLGGGIYLPAGTYWIGVFQASVAETDIAYDSGAGADRFYDSNTTGVTDWGLFAPTTTTKAHSIRASILR